MSQAAIWTVIIVAAAGTYAFRLSFLRFPQLATAWGPVRRALRFVPAAVLSALVAPRFLAPGGVADVSVQNLHLLAGLVGLAAAWRWRSHLLTIAIGMATLWLLAWLPTLVG